MQLRRQTTGIVRVGGAITWCAPLHGWVARDLVRTRAKPAPQQTKRLYGDGGGRDPAASDDRLGAKPEAHENRHELPLSAETGLIRRTKERQSGAVQTAL